MAAGHGWGTRRAVARPRAGSKGTHRDRAAHSLGNCRQAGAVHCRRCAAHGRLLRGGKVLALSCFAGARPPRRDCIQARGICVWMGSGAERGCLERPLLRSRDGIAGGQHGRTSDGGIEPRGEPAHLASIGESRGSDRAVWDPLRVGGALTGFGRHECALYGLKPTCGTSAGWSAHSGRRGSPVGWKAAPETSLPEASTSLICSGLGTPMPAAA